MKQLDKLMSKFPPGWTLSFQNVPKTGLLCRSYLRNALGGLIFEGKGLTHNAAYIDLINKIIESQNLKKPNKGQITTDNQLRSE